jgi:hypothetical protein
MPCRPPINVAWHQTLIIGQATLNRICHGFRQLERVAQTSSLPYRGFPIRRCSQAVTACRLEAGDTAGWKPALRSLGSPVPLLGLEMSGLIVAPEIPGWIKNARTTRFFSAA